MGSSFRRNGYRQISEEEKGGCGEYQIVKTRMSWSWLCSIVCAKEVETPRDVVMVVGCPKLKWRNLLWKLRRELRKMMRSRPAQRFQYDALSYSQNFDEGTHQDDPYARHLSFRFAGKLGVAEEDHLSS